jgi:hypothetical protein
MDDGLQPDGQKRKNEREVYGLIARGPGSVIGFAAKCRNWITGTDRSKEQHG